MVEYNLVEQVTELAKGPKDVSFLSHAPLTMIYP